MAAGNTVVVKPSEFSPISAGLMLAEIAEEAGFPKGVINAVSHAPGAAGEIASSIIAGALSGWPMRTAAHVTCRNTSY